SRNHSSVAGPVILLGCISNALPVLLLRSTRSRPPVRKLAEAGAASLIGTKKARIVTASYEKFSLSLIRKTGATRSIPAGRNGTSRFTVTSGGASFYGRSRNITAAENA